MDLTKESSLGLLIRKRREELGLSLEALGKKLGVSRQQLSIIELGKERLSDRLLGPMAEALGLESTILNALNRDRRRRGMRPGSGKVPSPNPSTLGEYFFARRMALKLTLQEVATKSGLSPMTVSFVEADARPWHRYRVTTLRQLCAGLGCDWPHVILWKLSRHPLAPRP